MYGYIMDNGPPSVDYEMIVRPVAVVPKCTAISGKDRRERRESRHRKRKRDEQDREFKDLLYEPHVGKLFDYTA